MAKSRSSNRRRRDTRRIAKRSLPTTVSSPRSIIQPLQYDLVDWLSQTEDRRTFHPDGPSRPARSRFQTFHRLQATPAVDKTAFWSNGVAFKAPKDVLVCVRRKMRKEVLHAINNAGKRGQKAPRRSEYSDIHC